jgi:hypothetical protein
MINFILSANDLNDSLGFKITEETPYRMAADVIYFHAEKPKEQNKCIAALACFLVIRDMATESKDIIKRHIRRLLGHEDTARLQELVFDKQADADTVEVRDRVEEMVKLLSELNLGPRA